MRKSIGSVLALAGVFVLVFTAVAAAQPGRMHHRGGFGGPMDIDRLAAVLSLTKEQQTQVQQLREKTKAALEPLFQEHRQLGEAVRTAQESGADATTVGNAAIAAHEHREKMRAVREQHETELEAILTPEQLARWEALKEARKLRHSPVPGLDPEDD